MKKYLLSLAAIVALSSSAFAASDNENKNGHRFMGMKRSMTVDLKANGSSFQIDAKTIADMPNASDLEISSFAVISPTGRIPGALALTLRPAGDMQVDMVGPQQGSFTFSTGELPQGLPKGRYLLTINGEVYGMLVISKDKIVLRQGLKPLPAEETAEDESEMPAEASY